MLFYVCPLRNWEDPAGSHTLRAECPEQMMPGVLGEAGREKQNGGRGFLEPGRAGTGCCTSRGIQSPAPAQGSRPCSWGGTNYSKVGKNKKDCEPAWSLHAGTVGVSVGTSVGEWVTEAESLLHKSPQDLGVAPQGSSKLGMKSS